MTAPDQLAEALKKALARRGRPHRTLRSASDFFTFHPSYGALIRKIVLQHMNRLKQLSRIATRYEKTAGAHLSMLCIASRMMWPKTVNAA
jgi:hypothetical protein